jgi:hypothetical protein
MSNRRCTQLTEFWMNHHSVLPRIDVMLTCISVQKVPIDTRMRRCPVGGGKIGKVEPTHCQYSAVRVTHDRALHSIQAVNYHWSQLMMIKYYDDSTTQPTCMSLLEHPFFVSHVREISIKVHVVMEAHLRTSISGRFTQSSSSDLTKQCRS